MKKSFYYFVLVQLVASYFCAVGVLAQATPGQPIDLNDTAPASYLIEDIQVIGTKTLDQEAIVSLAGLSIGDTVKIPGPAITDAVQRLWRQGLVKDIAIYAARVTDHCVVLTIHVTEDYRLSDYSFEGIKHKEQEKLTSEILLVKGERITEKRIEDTQRNIQDYWIKQGYANTTVDITSLPDPILADHIQLRIKINREKKRRVHSIYIEGNQHISSDVIKGQMQHIQEKPRFTLVKDVLKQAFTLKPIGKGGILWRPLSLKEGIAYYQKHVILRSSAFNQAKFEQDKACILRYYQCNGFSDAAIVKDAVYQQDDAFYNVWMQVEEGKKYRMGNINWVGNHLYDDAVLNQILKIKKGDIYNPVLLQQQLAAHPEGKDVASRYMNDGYLFFHADPVEVGLEGDTVALDIHIQEGPQAHIKQVLVEGNKMTHDHVIRRELRTLPGDKFNRAKLQRSYRELVQLNLFDPAIDIVPVPNIADKSVDIKYKVKERPKFEVKFSGGWGGQQSKIMLSMTLGTNNFSLGNLLSARKPIGGGQTLGLQAEWDGRKYKNFSLQFADPWLGGKQPRPFSLSFSKASEDLVNSIGGRVSLGTRLAWPDDYTVLRSALAYYHHTYQDYDLLANDRKTQGILHDFSVSVVVERDSTDSPIYPTEGSTLALHAKLTPPWSLFFNKKSNRHIEMKPPNFKEYHQWIVDGAYFLRLVDSLVLNIRGQFGVLGKFPYQKYIGPCERFYLGGVDFGERVLRGKEAISLRGYENDYIAPKDGVTQYKGGVLYDKFMLEIRYPIAMNQFISAYALAFAEAGNAWAEYKQCRPFDLKKSAGVGFRLYIPMILGTTLGFDWGYGFDNKRAHGSGDKSIFHFSIGMGMR